ncbi:MAG: hypothetical protein QW728_02145, partial [Thermoplasmata archaeon]
RPSSFAGNFSPTPIDTDGDGLFDSILINATVNITYPSRYRIDCSIWLNTYTPLDYREYTVDYNAGKYTVSFIMSMTQFAQRRTNSTLIVNLRIYDQTRWIELEYLSPAFLTSLYNWTDFLLPVRAEGTPAFFVEDTDNDGLYDYLGYTLSVYVEIPGTYQAIAYGYIGGQYQTSVLSNTYTFTSPGYYTVQVRWPAYYIYESRENNSWYIQWFAITDPAMSRWICYWSSESTPYLYYTQFAYRSRFTGIASFLPADLQPNGFYDMLNISIEINSLVEAQGQVNILISISWYTDYRSIQLQLQRGYNYINISLPASTIRMYQLEGRIRVVAYLSINNNNVDTYTYYSQHFNYRDFEPPTGIYGAPAIARYDDNSNSYYDRISLAFTVFAQQSGTCRLAATLRTPDYQLIQSLNTQASIGPGFYVITLNFSGVLVYSSGKTGSFRFTDIEFIWNNYEIHEYFGERYTEEWNWYEFERPAIILSNPGHTVVDTNSNGLYDFFNFTFSLTIIESGRYTLTAVLINPNTMDSFESAINVQMEAGLNPVSIPFEGWRISRWGIGNILYILRLTIQNYSTLQTLYILESPYVTTIPYSSFESPPHILSNITETTPYYGNTTYYSSLCINIPVETPYAGVFRLYAELMDASGNNIASPSITQYYPNGITQAVLVFPGSTGWKQLLLLLSRLLCYRLL